jgi:hydroxymethylbilane synthase
MTLDLDSPVRIGTRGSELALWQSNHVKQLLQRQFGRQLPVEIVVITTKGDTIQDRPLHEVGGKGLFVKEIEQHLLDGAVDLAVHSMKDLPAFMPDGLEIACTPAREDPRDAVVGVRGALAVPLSRLPRGARVGTGSLRRGAFVRRLNADVEIVPIRGNVPTRVAKVDRGEVDVVVLAAAGLRRLGLEERISELLDVERFCPAPAQGILALQCRSEDRRLKALLHPLRDASAWVCAAAERAFLQRLGAGCTTPVACHAELRAPDVLTLCGVIVDPAGRPCFTASKMSHPRDAAELGHRLADTLLCLGAARISGLQQVA